MNEKKLSFDGFKVVLEKLQTAQVNCPFRTATEDIDLAVNQ